MRNLFFRRKAVTAGGGTRNSMTNRSALTLFELLLVLVLLVVIGTLAAPLLDGSFSSIRLQRGTDQLLAAWSETRAHAIDSGVIYQFRFKPSEGTYLIEPWEPEQNLRSRTTASSSAASNSAASNSASNSQIGSRTTSKSAAETTAWTDEATLPDQVVFHTGSIATESREVGRAVIPLQESTRSAWSTPILFFPDGSSSSASVLLKNERDVYQRATLRALTGVGRSSGSLSLQEVDRYQFQ